MSAEPIRVLQITAIPVTARRFVLPLAEALAAEGYEVELATGPGEELEALEDGGFTVHRIPLSREVTAAGNFRALRRIRHLIKDRGFSIIHTHTPVASAVGRTAARGLPCKVLYTMHGSLWGAGVPNRSKVAFSVMERGLASLTHRVFTLNEHDARDCVTHAEYPEERVIRLPAGGAGVSRDFFDVGARLDEARAAARQEMGIGADLPVVGFVGRTTVAKGIAVLAQAFRSVANAIPDARLVVMGGALEGDQDAYDQAQFLEDVGTEHASRLRWLGFREDISTLMPALDLVVLPSYREGFGMGLAEAGAVGLPVVATETRGARTIVEHESTGLLVPIGDVGSLSDAIKRLLHDPEERATMGAAGRLRASERFTREAVLEAYLEAYRGLDAEEDAEVEAGAGEAGEGVTDGREAGAGETDEGASERESDRGAAEAGAESDGDPVREASHRPARRSTLPGPVRIAYVVDNLSFRGGERTFLQLVEGLDRSRYDIRVACSPGGVFVERLEALGVPVIPCNMRKKWRPDIAPRLIRDLRRFRPHIVHTQGRGDPYGRIAGQAAGADLVLSTTATVAGRYRVKARTRKAMYKAIDLVTDAMVDHYIVVNEESVEWLGRQHGVPPSRITVIYNGIELERYRPDPATRGLLRSELGIPADAFLVGGLGAFKWEKGFRYLIGAMVEVVQKGGWLVIGGDGDDRKAMEKQAAELGVQDYCLFPGFIHDVPAFLGDLDLFALSSLSEGHPMVLLEAMAMKCPIVSTDIAGARDSIEDGVSGILVPSKDAGALAGGILEVMEAEDRGRGMGEVARAAVEERFTVERVVAETDALYRELLASVT